MSTSIYMENLCFKISRSVTNDRYSMINAEMHIEKRGSKRPENTEDLSSAYMVVKRGPLEPSDWPTLESWPCHLAV